MPSLQSVQGDWPLSSQRFQLLGGHPYGYSEGEWDGYGQLLEDRVSQRSRGLIWLALVLVDQRDRQLRELSGRRTRRHSLVASGILAGRRARLSRWLSGSPGGEFCFLTDQSVGEDLYGLQGPPAGVADRVSVAVCPSGDVADAGWMASRPSRPATR